MTTMIEIQSLTPHLLMMLCWTAFMLTRGMPTSLLALLFTSLVLPLSYKVLWKMFWPCGLLIIVMTTGLFVIFTYIVSMSSGLKKTGLKIQAILAMLGFAGMMVVVFETLPPVQVIVLCPEEPSIEPVLSMTLFVLLLLLVVWFIRLVYSKGGGFRKKF